MSSDPTEEATPKLRLGGMALPNGLLVHGPTHWAVAVRTRDGQLRVASGRKPRLRALDRVPGLRGVVRLGEGMLVVPLAKLALPAARMPFQSPRAIAAAAAASAAGSLLRRRPGMAGEAAAATLALAPALVALGSGELAAYHGAEHKAIGAYEQGADAAEATKEHDRCGSHLVAPLLVSNLAGIALLRALLDSPGPLATGAVSLASVAVSVEAFAWAERNSGSPLARALRRPGHELQRWIGTREPSPEQLDVARAALAEALRAEGRAAAG